MTLAERWPPVYDAEDLARVVAKVARQFEAGDLFGRASPRTGPPVCQGDVLELDAGLPVLDAEGEPVVLEPDFQHWLVVGNTCDFDREVSEVRYTQLVPIWELGDLKGVPAAELAAFTRYQYARRFFVPPWPGASRVLRYADFLTPIGVEKDAVTDHAKIVARLSLEGWILLHSCLVRFLCRDDGRFDDV